MSRLVRLAPAAILSLVVCSLLSSGRLRADEKDLWQTDFEAAKAKAKAEKKLLLVDFTGSDWCGWCIKLKKEVFDEEAFKRAASKQFVCVELDFPRRKELPEKLQEQNQKLAKQFKIHGFPSILLVDPEEKLIARTGYRPDGPEPYVKHLGELVKTHEEVVGWLAKLPKTQGLDRAKLLDQVIDAYAKLENNSDEVDDWSKEIVKLDTDNKAGLKTKYEFRLMMSEFARLKDDRKFDEARAVIEKAAALPGITAQQKQDAYFAVGEVYFHQRDFAGLVKTLKRAVDAAPDGKPVEQIKGMLERFQPMADAQEAVAKIKGELEKAKGLDRAKLLDQLADARRKLGLIMPDRNLAKDLDEYAEEIIKLDADNKAGLKRKYEVRMLLSKAERALQAGEFDPAQKAIDEALALKDVPAEQIQTAQFLKGTAHLEQKEYAKALDALHKAVDAVPDGPRVPVIKIRIRRAEKALKDEQTAAEEKKDEKKSDKKDDKKREKKSEKSVS